MIIGIITSNSANLPIGFVESLIKVKNYDFIIQKGPSIPDNRNAVVDVAKECNDDLLFIDSDMEFTLEHVKSIENYLSSYDVVTGLCVMGNSQPSIFERDYDTFRTVEPKSGLFEVDGCGAAFLGISKRVLNTVEDAFTPMYMERIGRYYGEDISFCVRAKDKGFKIYCDSELKIGHIKPQAKYYSKYYVKD